MFGGKKTFGAALSKQKHPYTDDAALTTGPGVTSVRIEDMHAGSRVVFAELRFKAVGVFYSNVW